RQTHGVPPLPPLAPQARPPLLPLSFAQERLWFLEQLDPTKTAYNMTGAFRLCGRVDDVALRSAYADVVRRHEILRTTYPMTDARPVQVILDASRLRLGRERG